MLGRTVAGICGAVSAETGEGGCSTVAMAARVAAIDQSIRVVSERRKHVYGSRTSSHLLCSEYNPIVTCEIPLVVTPPFGFLACLLQSAFDRLKTCP
jgi:hypothetical protein